LARTLLYWNADDNSLGKGHFFFLVGGVPGNGREKEFYWPVETREREMSVKIECSVQHFPA